VREVFFEGFRMLRGQFGALVESDDTRADLIRVIEAFRAFALANPCSPK